MLGTCFERGGATSNATRAAEAGYGDAVMHALQLTEPGRPLELRSVDRPEAPAGEVLVQVEAAGICRSDLHYRKGFPVAGPLPITLGHEIAGVVAEVGAGVDRSRIGRRVCLHYQIGCGSCRHCRAGNERFCPRGAMLGKDRDGGYAEFITLPSPNALLVPDEVTLAHAAVMMCSTATALHALRRCRLSPGERVAIFGAGGLGASAIQLARSLGAAEVFAVDVNSTKLSNAEALGARPVDGADQPVDAIRAATDGNGVEVALDLLGSPDTLAAAVAALAPLGRAGVVGLIEGEIRLQPYRDVLVGEAELIGTSDHTAAELSELLKMARAGSIDLSNAITRTVPLDPAEVNGALDRLEAFGDDIRTVITPGEV